MHASDFWYWEKTKTRPSKTSQNFALPLKCIENCLTPPFFLPGTVQGLNTFSFTSFVPAPTSKHGCDIYLICASYICKYHCKFVKHWPIQSRYVQNYTHVHIDQYTVSSSSPKLCISSPAALFRKYRIRNFNKMLYIYHTKFETCPGQNALC